MVLFITTLIKIIPCPELSQVIKMNKEEFFYEPRTVSEIHGGKYVSLAIDNIAERILQMREYEGLLISPIVPEEYESRARFLKRAPQVVLDTGRNSFNAMRNGITPSKALKNACEKLDNDEKYCGIAWKSLRKNEHKRISLVDCIRGSKLFAYSELANAEISVKDYNELNDAAYMGGKFKVKVNSRTPKQPRYDLTIESVPVVRSVYNPVIWTDLTATHACGITENDFSYRYISSEDFCPHVIAAYLKVAKDAKENGELTPVKFMPFPLPSELTVDFYNKLANQVMVREKIGENRRRKRPLNKAEKEILLWDLVKIMGPEATLQAKKKLANYEWQKAA